MAALSITVAAGGITVANQKSIVTDAAENWQVGELDNKYLYGTLFEAPAATVEINGETVEATATVTYPNGLTTTAENVQLNQAGIYTVTYRAVVGDTHCVQKKTFEVEDKAYLLQSEKSSAAYGTYTEYGANSSGLLVRLAQNDTLTFSQLIDFDSLTSTDSLIKLFITPDTQGVYDFSRLVMTFTDVTDSSVYLQFRLSRYPAEDRGMNAGYLDVAGNGQTPIGCEHGVHRTTLGTPFGFTFSAARHEGNAWSGPVEGIPPDYDQCSITYDLATTEAKVNGAHIAHLNNLEYFETAWTGFPSGKAKLTISAEKYSADTANFCITSIFGIDDLSEASFNETEGPMIDVSMSQEEIPQGQVGYEYVIPEASAFDFYSGACEVRTSVYRDYTGDAPISVGVVNGKFKPTVAGWHTIVYTSKDMLGNISTETRNVYIAWDLGDIEVTLPETITTSATLGSWVPVGKASYTGDCGLATVRITATLGEETYEITDGFLPEIEGEWKVRYTVTDYIGREGTAEYTVNAVVGDGFVVLDELILPQIFVSDSEYVLPEIYANDYSSGKAERYLCQVVVSDKNGDKTYTAGNAFTPSVAENGDMVKISYQYEGEELVVREVPAVLVKDTGKIIAKNYLYGEGFSTSFKNDNDEWYDAGIAVIADKASALCGWTFATPQFASNFSMTFEGIASRASFEELKITLTDSQNAKEQICIELKVKTVGTTVVVGDTVVEVANTSLAADQQYTVSYSNGKFGFGGVSVEAVKTVSGEDFTGFTSKRVYARVEMVNASEGAGYKVLSVCGSNLSRRNLEMFAPAFEILGEFGGNQSINAVCEIFPAIANDVFAPNVSMKLTVKAPDGTIVVDNDGVKLENVETDKSYIITLSQYGKYQATYTVVEEDWVAENVFSLVKTILVIDESAPQAKFINATQTTAKVGEIITLPDVVFRDNTTANENLTVITGVFNPSGKFYLFTGNENSIQCLYTGEYTFIAMVSDEFGNMTTVTHVVTVTE